MKAPASSLEELPFRLAKTALGFRRFNELTLRAAGLQNLAPGYASVLHALDALGDCTVSRLVETTHLPNGTLTGLLDGLEQDGHLQRAANPRDGRSWRIQLTASGRKLCKTLKLRHRKVVAFLGDSFTEAEAAELIRLLEKATDRMRAYSPTQKPAMKSRSAPAKVTPRKH